MSKEKRAIDQYNADLKQMGGYIYTGNAVKKSMNIFNERASRKGPSAIDS